MVSKGVFDQWNDMSGDSLAGLLEVLRDDCDTCAITNAGITNKKYNIPANEIKIWLVCTEVGQAEGKYIDHMVCEIDGYVLIERDKQGICGKNTQHTKICPNGKK